MLRATPPVVRTTRRFLACTADRPTCPACQRVLRRVHAGLQHHSWATCEERTRPDGHGHMDRCGQHVLLAGQPAGWCLAIAVERHEFDRLRLDGRTSADILLELGVIAGRAA